MTPSDHAHSSFLKHAYVAAAVFGLACMPAPTPAASIGLNFLNLGGDSNSFESQGSGIFHDNAANFLPADIAGAPGFAQANWNQLRGDWSGLSVNDAAHAMLVNSAGNPVTNLGVQSVNGDNDYVSYDSNNLWASGVYGQSGGQLGVSANDTLMNGFLDDGGSNEPLIIVDLKYDGEAGADDIVSYTVIVYVNGDQTGQQLGRYWIEDESTQQSITDLVGIDNGDYTFGGPFVSAGTYSQTASPQLVAAPSGNYIVFDGITADRIRVRGGGNDDSGDRSYGRAPINGIQIVAQLVPEPSSAAIVAAIAATFCLRRPSGLAFETPTRLSN